MPVPRFGPGSRAGDAGKECGAGFDQGATAGAAETGSGSASTAGTSSSSSPSVSRAPPRIIETATYPRRSAKSRTGCARRRGRRSTPPTSAPIAVNSSRPIPSLLVREVLEVDAGAAALLVMITQTSDTPTAERRSSPKPSVSSGTTRTPPAKAEQRSEDAGGEPADEHQQPTSTSGDLATLRACRGGD